MKKKENIECEESEEKNTNEETQKIVFKLKNTLNLLTIQNKMGKLIKVHQLRLMRREIARLLTKKSSINKTNKNNSN